MLIDSEELKQFIHDEKQTVTSYAFKSLINQFVRNQKQSRIINKSELIYSLDYIFSKQEEGEYTITKIDFTAQKQGKIDNILIEIDIKI